MRPTARVGRNRRCAYLYSPAIAAGTAAILAALPTVNGGYLAGVALVLAGAAGFVRETGKDQ
ncbi:hypothetical protein ASF72_10765 [Arthrobacter sp. Leaf141]|uniref:hypothetical protein n=1 Tax=Arthrobacter sp. Leaf141 TaxID=1736273 RepID=UPI0006F3B67E|nr:hypothetical protein [Arthrobacter sp. Leaf141]KQR02507.1 hypothetical protein ASF72_10765 [Arthrobacter sp. Leaf141]